MDADQLTAVAAIISAFGVPLTALFAWMAVRKGKKNEKAIEQVHVIVNSRMSAVLARVEQLTGALEESDTEVPADPHE